MSRIWIVLAVLVAMLIGVGIGNAVTSLGSCHSVTEDSAPYDCSYDGDTNEWSR